MRTLRHASWRRWWPGGPQPRQLRQWRSKSWDSRCSTADARAVRRVSTHRGRDQGYRHLRYVQVGSLLRSQRAPRQELLHHCALHRSNRKAACKNKNHDLFPSFRGRSARVIRARGGYRSTSALAGRDRGAPEWSGGRRNAGTGSGQDGISMGTFTRTSLAHLALTSSRPGHTRVPPYSPERRGTNRRRRAANRTPLVGASALHDVSGTHSMVATRCTRLRRACDRSSPRSHLGSTLGSGKSCPDPGRLSTFGVSGLCSCRRLTYRGACSTMLAPQTGTRQTAA